MEKDIKQSILMIDKLLYGIIESLGGEQEELEIIWWQFDKWARKLIPDIDLL